ncbi:MAG: carboxylesterase [Pseudomonadales bacterium]|jgi:phospholipase/carboxylesterase
MSDLLECVEIDPGQAVGSIIWLHGLGADAHDFEPIVPQLGLNQPLRFVFPNAPIRPVSINAGMEMRAWYDLDPGAPLSGDQEISESAESICRLVERERERGIPSDRITLAGFSQGGVIALQVGLGFDERLAGIMALSTYVHDHERLVDRVSFANIDVPIFMAHGISDPMIPITRAITSREALLTLNYSVQWHEYGMGHQVCPEEINDISAWLNSIYP